MNTTDHLTASAAKNGPRHLYICLDRLHSEAATADAPVPKTVKLG